MKNALWLVESEPISLQLHANILSKSGYVVKTFTNPEGLNAALAESAAPNLLIMGTLADGKSLSTLRQLRQQGLEFPIFMMSSSSDPIDLIMAFEVGADDFLVKPVNPRELLARIQACLRRIHRPAKEAAPERFRFGPFVLDLTERTLEKGKKTRSPDHPRVRIAEGFGQPPPSTPGAPRIGHDGHGPAFGRQRPQLGCASGALAQSH